MVVPCAQQREILGFRGAAIDPVVQVVGFAMFGWPIAAWKGASAVSGDDYSAYRGVQCPALSADVDDL